MRPLVAVLPAPAHYRTSQHRRWAVEQEAVQTHSKSREQGTPVRCASTASLARRVFCQCALLGRMTVLTHAFALLHTCICLAPAWVAQSLVVLLACPPAFFPFSADVNAQGSVNSRVLIAAAERPALHAQRTSAFAHPRLSVPAVAGVSGSRRELLSAAAVLMAAAQAPRPARAAEPGPPAVALEGKPATGEAANITAAPATEGETTVSALLVRPPIQSCLRGTLMFALVAYETITAMQRLHLHQHLLALQVPQVLHAKQVHACE